MESYSYRQQAVSLTSETALTVHAIRICKMITHYCCDRCKFQSLSNIDFRSSNKPRCSLCGFRVNLGRSKFTKLRRKIILSLHQPA